MLYSLVKRSEMNIMTIATKKMNIKCGLLEIFSATEREKKHGEKIRGIIDTLLINLNFCQLLRRRYRRHLNRVSKYLHEGIVYFSKNLIYLFNRSHNNSNTTPIKFHYSLFPQRKQKRSFTCVWSSRLMSCTFKFWLVNFEFPYFSFF